MDPLEECSGLDKSDEDGGPGIGTDFADLHLERFQAAEPETVPPSRGRRAGAGGDHVRNRLDCALVAVAPG
jgi:hypothetical protein